jgi:hypothetical protein
MVKETKLDVIALVFTGLPAWEQAALFIAFLLIGGMATAVAFLDALKALRRPLRPPESHPPLVCPFQRELEVRRRHLLRQQARNGRDRFRPM